MVTTMYVTALLIAISSGVQAAAHDRLTRATGHNQLTTADQDEVKLTVHTTDTMVYVNCTFSRSKSSNMAAFVSLSIIDDGIRNNKSIVWAHIDVNSTTATAQNSFATGDIHRYVGGFLTVTWVRREIFTKANLSCRAEGISATGQTVTNTKYAVLNVAPVTYYVHRPTSTPTCESVQGTLKDKLTFCKRQAAAQKAFIEDLKTKCDVTSPCTPTTTPPPRPHLPVGFSHQSGLLHRHRYLLTRPMLTDIVKAQQLCRQNNAYLAEIQDRSEYSYVTNFLNEAQVGEQIYIGMNFTLGRWLYSSSSVDVTFFNWNTNSHQPYTNQGRDCVILIPEDSLEMSCTVCQQPEDDFKRRYLCEQPQTDGSGRGLL